MWKRGKRSAQERLKKRSIAIGYPNGNEKPNQSQAVFSSNTAGLVQAPPPAVQKKSDPYHKLDYGSRVSDGLVLPRVRGPATDQSNTSKTTFQFPHIRRALTFSSHALPSNDGGHRRTISADQIQSHAKLRTLNRIASQAGSVLVNPLATSLRERSSSSESFSGSFCQRGSFGGALLNVIHPGNLVAFDIEYAVPTIEAMHSQQPLDVAAVIDTSSVLLLVEG